MGTPLTIVLGMGRTRPKKSKILFEIWVFSTNKDRKEFIGPKIIFSNVLGTRFHNDLIFLSPETKTITWHMLFTTVLLRRDWSSGIAGLPRQY